MTTAQEHISAKLEQTLAFESMQVRIGGRTVLDGATLAIKPGVLTGIVGPNGAGKTTLMRAGLGLLPISAGTIRILGKPLKDWRRNALAKTVAYLPQGGESGWPMHAADVVMLGRLPHIGRFAPPAPLDFAAVDDALARCDAMPFAERRMDELSSGERARVLLARALATQAPILLVDEPAAFLDPAHQFALMSLLQNEAKRGTAVAVTLHDLSLACDYCDRLIVLSNGTVAAMGPADTVLDDEILSRVFSLAFRDPRDSRKRHFSTLRKI